MPDEPSPKPVDCRDSDESTCSAVMLAASTFKSFEIMPSQLPSRMETRLANRIDYNLSRGAEFVIGGNENASFSVFAAGCVIFLIWGNGKHSSIDLANALQGKVNCSADQRDGMSNLRAFFEVGALCGSSWKDPDGSVVDRVCVVLVDGISTLTLRVSETGFCVEYIGIASVKNSSAGGSGKTSARCKHGMQDRSTSSAVSSAKLKWVSAVPSDCDEGVNSYIPRPVSMTLLSVSECGCVAVFRTGKRWQVVVSSLGPSEELGKGLLVEPVLPGEESPSCHPLGFVVVYESLVLLASHEAVTGRPPDGNPSFAESSGMSGMDFVRRLKEQFSETLIDVRSDRAQQEPELRPLASGTAGWSSLIVNRFDSGMAQSTQSQAVKGIGVRHDKKTRLVCGLHFGLGPTRIVSARVIARSSESNTISEATRGPESNTISEASSSRVAENSPSGQGAHTCADFVRLAVVLADFSWAILHVSSTNIVPVYSSWASSPRGSGLAQKPPQASAICRVFDEGLFLLAEKKLQEDMDEGSGVSTQKSAANDPSAGTSLSAVLITEPVTGARQNGDRQTWLGPASGSNQGPSVSGSDILVLDSVVRHSECSKLLMLRTASRENSQKGHTSSSQKRYTSASQLARLVCSGGVGVYVVDVHLNSVEELAALACARANESIDEISKLGDEGNEFSVPNDVASSSRCLSELSYCESVHKPVLMPALKLLVDLILYSTSTHSDRDLSYVAETLVGSQILAAIQGLIAAIPLRNCDYANAVLVAVLTHYVFQYRGSLDDISPSVCSSLCMSALRWSITGDQRNSIKSGTLPNQDLSDAGTLLAYFLCAIPRHTVDVGGLFTALGAKSVLGAKTTLDAKTSTQSYERDSLVRYVLETVVLGDVRAGLSALLDPKADQKDFKSVISSLLTGSALPGESDILKDCIAHIEPRRISDAILSLCKEKPSIVPLVISGVPSQEQFLGLVKNLRLAAFAESNADLRIGSDAQLGANNAFAGWILGLLYSRGSCALNAGVGSADSLDLTLSEFLAVVDFSLESKSRPVSNSFQSKYLGLLHITDSLEAACMPLDGATLSSVTAKLCSLIGPLAAVEFLRSRKLVGQDLAGASGSGTGPASDSSRVVDSCIDKFFAETQQSLRQSGISSEIHGQHEAASSFTDYVLLLMNMSRFESLVDAIHKRVDSLCADPLEGDLHLLQVCVEYLTVVILKQPVSGNMLLERSVVLLVDKVRELAARTGIHESKGFSTALSAFQHTIALRRLAVVDETEPRRLADSSSVNTDRVSLHADHVSFFVSCLESVRGSFENGLSLLEEARIQRQSDRVECSGASCMSCGLPLWCFKRGKVICFGCGHSFHESCSQCVVEKRLNASNEENMQDQPNGSANARPANAGPHSSLDSPKTHCKPRYDFPQGCPRCRAG